MAALSLCLTVLSLLPAGFRSPNSPFSGSNPYNSIKGTQTRLAFSSFIPSSPALHSRNARYPTLFSPAMFKRAKAWFPLPEPSCPPSLTTVREGFRIAAKYAPACPSCAPKWSEASIDVARFLPLSSVTSYSVNLLCAKACRSRLLLNTLAPNIRVPAPSIPRSTVRNAFTNTNWTFKHPTVVASYPIYRLLAFSTIPMKASFLATSRAKQPMRKDSGEMPLNAGKVVPLDNLRDLYFPRGWAFAYTSNAFRPRKWSPATPASFWDDLPSTLVKTAFSMILSFHWSPPGLAPFSFSLFCLGPGTLT